MQKLGLLFKETFQKQINIRLKESEGIFILNYSKLSSPDLTGLRQTLKGSAAKLLVVKNSVARRALKEAKLEELSKSIDGPCGLIFAKEEPINVSRLLWEFFKAHEQIKLLGGALEDRIIDPYDIEALAKLPSREILRHKVVLVLNSPISGLARTLNQLLRKFVYCLEQVRQKKTTTGGQDG